MFVTGSAAAKKRERLGAGIPKFVLFAGRDCDGVASFDFGKLAFDAHATLAVGDEIDFLGPGVVMLLGAGAGRKASFGQALVADGGIAVGEQFADFRTGFRDEG